MTQVKLPQELLRDRYSRPLSVSSMPSRNAHPLPERLPANVAEALEWDRPGPAARARGLVHGSGASMGRR
ncbi:MAG TPA: hypothetical protein VF168_05085 [Trueperaceae bacterium]